MVAPNTIENPSGSSTPTTDIYAATRVVSPIAGQGTDLTIEAAIAALPVEGGLILVKQGTYTPPVGGYILPNKPVEIVGCASDASAVATGTTIDATAHVGPIFVKSFKHNYRIADLTVIGSSLVGQTFFDASAVGDGSGWAIIENVHILNVQNGFLLIPASGDLLFVRMTKVNFEPAGGAASKLWSNGTGVSQSGKLECDQCTIVASVIEDNPEVTLTGCHFDCTQSAGVFTNLLGSLFASSCELYGEFKVKKNRGTQITGCSFGYGIFGVAPTRFIDFPLSSNPATVVGCTFLSPGSSEEIRNAGDYLSVYDCQGNGFIPKVTETGTANFNRYEDIELTSTILGAKTIVNQWNTRDVAVNTTLDETHRTVLVDATGAARTITLPTAASAKYRKYTIKKIDASVNTVTIDAAGAELIDGALTVVIGIQYGSITVQSNGTEWSTIVSDASGPFGIFAATRIVSLTPGEGTDLTIAAAIAALPAAGGDIYVKGGTYPIAAALDFTTKVVRLRGAGTSVDFTTGPVTLVPAAGISLFKNGAKGSSIEDITAVGDNATSQVFYEGTGEIRFSRINTHDIGGIIKGAAEITFHDSYIEIPSGAIPLADQYVWKAAAAGGTLIFDNVELFVVATGATLMSGVTASQNGPTFKVVNSYVGGGGGGGSTNFWFAQQVEWTQFEIDNAQFEISNAFNTIVNCGFLDFSIKFLGIWNFISNSKFSQGGTDAPLFDAQVTFVQGFTGIPQQNTVVGCLFYGNGVSVKGISFTGAGAFQATQLAISGCIFQDHVSRGVDLAGCAEVSISGCVFKGGATGIKVSAGAFVSERISITGNTFKTGLTFALELEAFTCTIAGNASLNPISDTGNGNAYSNNTSFNPSGISGLSASSRVDDKNVQGPSAADVVCSQFTRTQLIDATAAARTVTLQLAADAKWREITVKKTDASVNTVTIDASGAETIDGSLTIVLTVQYQSITVQSDGISWWII